MSSNSNDLLLNGREYSMLSYKPKSIAAWFDAWNLALDLRDYETLLNLTHRGLQYALHREETASVTRLFCHYLAVADGHGSAKNFGHHGTLSSASDFGVMSKGELMQKLSDKAWMELCNRVFVFSEDYGGYGQQLKYGWCFREPELAQAMLRFIDPERWSEDGLYRLERANIDILSKCAYQAKALLFVRAFLSETWDYREIKERESQFYDPQKREAMRTDSKFVESMKFFRKLKPQLARLMIHYDMARFLHDRQLDHPTRKILETVVRDLPNISEMTLDEAYGHRNPAHGYFTVNHREVARILIMYPYLVRGRRRYVREQVRRKREEKATEQAELLRQFKAIEEKIKATQ